MWTQPISHPDHDPAPPPQPPLMAHLNPCENAPWVRGAIKLKSECVHIKYIHTPGSREPAQTHALHSTLATIASPAPREPANGATVRAVDRGRPVAARALAADDPAMVVT